MKIDLSEIDFSKVVEFSAETEFYKHVTLNILDYLKRNRKATYQQLIKFVEGNDRRVLRLLDQMVKAKLIHFKKPYFHLTKSAPNNQSFENLFCPNCESKMVNFIPSLKKIAAKMKKIYAQKPTPTFVFDQRPVNCLTTVRRVGYAIWRGDVHDKKIVFIGDDDLTSVALAFSGLASKITVFDIDKRLLDFIDKVAKENNLEIETVCADLTQGISIKYFGKFDVFMTDPTPREKSLAIFCDIGLELLKPSGGIGYISANPSHSPKTLDLQKIVTKMNILITDSIPFFTEYDFNSFTFSQNDNQLLEKYSSSEDKITFYEYFIRMEVTEQSKKIPLKFTLEDIVGRAQKRVLNNPILDPVLSKGGKDAEIVKQIAKQFQK